MKKILLSFLVFFATIVSFGSPENASASSQFRDVGSSYWALKEITYLQNSKIISGFPDGSFRPGASVTRAQAAMMINRSLKFNTTNIVDPGFTDIKAGNSAYKDVAALVKAGVIPKTETFRPYDALTRAEMASFLVKGYKLKGTFSGEIKDVSADLLPTVKTLAGNGVTAMYPDNTFRPNQPVTRAQFSAFMARVIDPNFRATYSLLHLFLPEIDFDMSVAEVKQKMKKYVLEDEVQLPLGTSDHQITYAAKVTELAENEQLLFLFKDDKLIHVLINVDNYTSVKPTAVQLDEKFNVYQNYFKPYVGVPKKLEQIPTDEIILYSKKGIYQGNFVEDSYLIVQGYDFREHGEEYMTTYMLSIKKK